MFESILCFQARLLHATDLRNLDSHFARVGNVDVHYSLQLPRNRHRAASSSAVHCFHGFGANTASWGYMRQQLSDMLNAQVTAHDMPGFGLTGR